MLGFAPVAYLPLMTPPQYVVSGPVNYGYEDSTNMMISHYW